MLTEAFNRERREISLILVVTTEKILLNGVSELSFGDCEYAWLMSKKVNASLGIENFEAAAMD